MKWRRSKKSTRAPGEFSPANVKSFMRTTLPTVSPAQAEAQLQYLRGKGFTEEWIARFILPYMPPDPPPPPAGSSAAPGADPSGASSPAGVVVPATVSRDWLDRHLPAMDRGQMRRVVEALERRGWSPETVAMAVLPHLLPKLPADEQQVILGALADMGMTEEEIRAATARR